MKNIVKKSKKIFQIST